MLAFIDESGHPHPNDPNQRPVVVAVCMEERQGRLVAGRLHGLKRDFLGRERTELKGNKFINRRAFRRKPDYVSFLEELFNTLLNMPLTVLPSSCKPLLNIDLVLRIATYPIGSVS